MTDTDTTVSDRLNAYLSTLPADVPLALETILTTAFLAGYSAGASDTHEYAMGAIENLTKRDT